MKSRQSQNSKHLNRTSGWSLALVWFLTVIFPALIIVAASEYLKQKQLEHERIVALTEAENQIDQFNHLLNCESFLADKIAKISQQIGSYQKISAKELEKEIGKIVGVKPVYAIVKFREKNRFVASNYRPDDIKKCTLPPAVLFRKIFQELATEKKGNDDNFERLAVRNRLQIQQMFKTLTTNTLLKNKVLRNFSFYLGGEIYFTIIEFAPESPVSHGILLFRGRDISARKLAAFAMSQVKNTWVVLKELRLKGNFSGPESFKSSVKGDDKGMTLIRSANQSFIRHYLHNGGIKILHAVNKVPFIRHRINYATLSNSRIQQNKLIKTACLLFVLLFSLAFFRFSFFGMHLSQSLKKRILIAILLAAIFPLGVLSSCIYLYQKYDQHISKLNLLQHLEIRIAQNSEQLIQKTKQFETFIETRPSLLSILDGIDQKGFSKLSQELARVLPFSEASYITATQTFSFSLPERSALFNMSSDDPVWSFFPSHILRWMKEDGRKNRVPQHYFPILGQKVKASFLNDAMQQFGGFFLINQGAVPVWLSSIRVPDRTKKEFELKGILHLKYELGPILKSFYEISGQETNKFRDKLGKYEIFFGYFPLRKTSNHDYWQGSFNHQDLELFAPFLQHEENQDIPNASGYTMVRINQGFKHKIIAIARTLDQSGETNEYRLYLPGLIYILLVLTFASLLLDHFFVKPIHQMAESAEEIARGGEEWRLKLETGDELEHLNLSFSGLIEGLKQRNALKGYVSADAFSEIEQNLHRDLFPGGEYQDVSVLFVSMKLPEKPDEEKGQISIIAAMDNFLNLCDKCCQANSGSIDKIIEQTIMLVFRSTSGNNHALNAASAALQIKTELLKSDIEIQAGIASGKVISGRIGSYSGKLDFTVIGDTVNLAARLKSEAQKSSSGIIVSGSTMRLLKGKGRVRFLRRSSIKGKSREFNLYELLELR